MKTQKLFVEYGVQYRFSPRGRWYDFDGEQFIDEGEAKKEYQFQMYMANDGYHDGCAKYWRVVKRMVTTWEEVK